MARSLIPGKVCIVEHVPPCFFCGEDAEDDDAEVPKGPYDFATRMGPWASGCERHWRMYRAAPGLGTGKAQLWVTEDQVDRDNRTIILPGSEELSVSFQAVIEKNAGVAHAWAIQKLPPSRFELD